MTSDLGVIATPWPWSSWSQVVTATDGFTRMPLGVRLSLEVCNRSSLTFRHATYSLKIRLVCACFWMKTVTTCRYTYCCISWCVWGSLGLTPWPGPCEGFWLWDRGRTRSPLRISSTSRCTRSGCRFQHEMVRCRRPNILPKVTHWRCGSPRRISTWRSPRGWK